MVQAASGASHDEARSTQRKRKVTNNTDGQGTCDGMALARTAGPTTTEAKLEDGMHAGNDCVVGQGSVDARNRDQDDTRDANREKHRVRAGVDDEKGK